MARVVLLAAVALTLGACTQEVVTVRESSIARQFASLNKDGWSVTRADQTGRHAGTAADPNVRVVKEADFSGLTFHTNFQVEDPKLKEQQQRAATQPASTRPGAGSNVPPPALPFGNALPGQ